MARPSATRAAQASPRDDLLARFADLQPQVRRRFDTVIRGSLPEELDGVTPHQLNLLRRLRRGPERMSELAKFVGISENAATALADRLVRLNLVERLPDTTDRRVVRLGLTDKSRPILERHYRAHRKALAAALTHISDRQISDMIRVFETIIEDVAAGGA